MIGEECRRLVARVRALLEMSQLHEPRRVIALSPLTEATTRGRLTARERRRGISVARILPNLETVDPGVPSTA